MCGICGAAGPERRAFDPEVMLEAMHHRGPDGRGLWQGGDVVLGHRRLAIVDLSERGAQPLVSSDGQFAVSVNGEIYNYLDLRSELEDQGAVFSSDCDSEVVLHAYRAWGEDSFARLNGMFAFALWDATQRRLLLVRDRMGIKPLYYLAEAQTLAFASDARALMRSTGRCEWPVDAEGLVSYLGYQNRFGEETLFSGIRMLAPGACLSWKDGRLQRHMFWHFGFPEPCLANAEEAVARFRQSAQAAVARHLMSDVPPAAYLSAGFDSSLVASLAAHELDGALATYTGTFREGGWYDEAEVARVTAARLGVAHQEVELNANVFQEALDDMVYALEEPRMGMGALPQYIVARWAARSHKMILTGHGGDELFSGYPVFKLALFLRLLRRAPSKLTGLLCSLRLSELPHLVYFSLKAIFARNTRRFIPVLFTERDQRRGLRASVVAALQRAEVGRHDGGPYEILFATYLRDYLPGLLVVEDKISMAHSLEARTPFLDNELVDLSLGVCEEVKLSGGQLKYVIKSGARGVVPDELYHLPKRGFPTPLSIWLRGELREWMLERLTGETSALRRLFCPEYLDRTVKGYLTSWKRRVRPLDEIQTHRMWMLLCLESWLRQYETRLGIRLVLPGESEGGDG